MDFTNISTIQLEQKISDVEIRQMRIINISMLMGVLILLVSTMYLNYFGSNSGTGGADYKVLNIFLIMVFALMIIGFPLVFSIHKIFLSPGRIAKIHKQGYRDTQGNRIENPVDILLIQYRTLLIFKLAILEGIALLGITSFLTGVFADLMRKVNIYWFLLLPSIFFFIFVYLFFPTKDKVVFYIEQNILPKFRGV